MELFEDLIFKKHPNPMLNGKQAIMDFPNGWGVSVIIGEDFKSNSVDTYEVAIRKDKKLNFDNELTQDVIGDVYDINVSEIMERVQLFKKEEK